ncbi:T9SS type A sorting domain-containing protein [uncultured Polaribacter sp.]|uniref:T9SS type A sorting domain-containing protein n=1 Tax=uncultured Polaribacter sp. TaxID=174711 RepID=UPI0037048095
MIKKITQNVTKLIWRNSLFAFALLLSMTANSQEVDDEYLLNPGINSTLGTSTTPSTGVDGNGQMSASNTAGWTEYNSVAYIDSGGTDGNCHSEDRMFRLYKKGGTSGQFVAQTVTLPAGNYNWSFWTKWGVVVDYNAGDAEKPEFTISAGETVLQTTITTQPNAIETWVEQTGVFNNQIARDITIKFYKYGGVTGNESNLNQLMFVDDVSLKYAGPFTYPEDDTSLSDLTQDGATIAGFTESKTTYDIFLAGGTTVVPTIAATPNNANATIAITDATSIPGTTTIFITAEDGTTTNTVSINFSIPALGQEFLTNPNINTTATSTDTGVDGSGNMPANLGGWGSGANGSYAPTSAGNGDCHSEDRMFKFFKKNDAIVTQTLTLPAGTYDWSFWTRWAALVTWAADGDVKPKFTIMTDDDGDGSWTAVQTTITTQPTAVNSWVQQTGTYSNDISRQVRIKFSKSGGTTAEPTNLQELMYIDDVSLKYNGATLGVSDQDIMSFSIYPNPATDLISISGVDNIKSIKVYSILGSLEKEVFNTNQIDISELSSGIHLIKVDNGTGTAFTEKIIKQ